MDSKGVFGQNVKRIRKRRGLSQEELAERAGLHRTYVGGVERGERNIALENIVALGKALGCSIADLFAGIETKPARRTP